MNTVRDYKSFDVTIVIVTLGLCLFGLAIVPSAGAGLDIPASAFRMQKVWIVTGVGVMLAAAFIDYEFLCRFYIPLYVVNILMLAVVVALKIVWHKSWLREIDFGPISLIPSEFSKLFTVIFLAKAISMLGDRINRFIPLSVLVVSSVCTFGLIFLEPSLSASVVILFITAAMLYVGKLKLRWFVVAAVLSAIVFGVLWYDINRPEGEHLILKDYQIEDRVRPFLDPENADPDSYYQSDNSQRAIRSGGLYGNGLYGNKIHVPDSYNDFIFAIIASEFGFFGALAALAAGFFLAFKCLLVAWRSEVFLGKLLAAGVGAMFAFHMFVNVGVASGMLPNTGITFPFISSGGSSIWISMASVGIVLNVKMTKVKQMFD